MDPATALLGKTDALIAARRRWPESTYRLQFHAGFTFRDAERIAPYLRELGITHCYASPYLRARPGSTHGYDIVDHNSLNPEIGSEADYEAFVAALRANDLGQVLDTVPNHMGVGTNDNAWWNDVLENGPAARHADYFDIAWHASMRPQLQDKVLLPVLGDPYGDVLEKGQLRLAFADGAFTIHYYDRRFPLAPRSYGLVLSHRADQLEQALGAEAPALMEYESILTAIRNLPDRQETDPARVVERQREKEVIKRRLATLASESAPVREFIEQNITIFNGTPGDPHSFDLLDELLEHQCYRPSYWRVASDEINYRRFFDINDLAALSMEREDVFEAAHRLVLRLLAEGKIDGLRIDHPDGLYDPAQYFRRLQAAYVLACARQVFTTDADFQGGSWEEIAGPLRSRIHAELDAAAQARRWPLYVVAEKILAADEPLVETWAVAGTSGYDFMNQVNGLFIDPAGAEPMSRLYYAWVEDASRFAELVYRKKRLILQASLSSELHMLAHQLDRLAQKSRRSRDFTFIGLRDGLREVIACFPVYRSYIADDGIHAADRRYVVLATRLAAVRNPLVSRWLFYFIRDMLLLEAPESFTEADRAEQRQFAGKFQQVTAPVTAKGVEDTAFYVYNRLVALNEVGGDPGRFGTAPAAVHAYCSDRLAKWPYALSPLSTHDTKRSEDVRARISVLSEMPEEWAAALVRWSRMNDSHRGHIDDVAAPDAGEEYLLYQTLLGAWPLEPMEGAERATFVERMQAYMLKAIHEAKVHTNWVNPNEEHDRAVRTFVERILDPRTSRAFLDDFRVLQARVSHHGMFNALAQTLLKFACPGAPDTYQGTELWDFSLVDPDNRRPVDYERRRRMLDELRQAAGGDLAALARELVQSRLDGRIKLYVTWQALHCRREHPGLFSAGDYLPLEAAGAKADHLFAFARRAGDRWAVVAVPRLTVRLLPEAGGVPLGTDVWQHTRLLLRGVDPALRWRDVFTGATPAALECDGQLGLNAAELFAHFPVALLVADRAGEVPDAGSR